MSALPGVNINAGGVLALTADTLDAVGTRTAPLGPAAELALLSAPALPLLRYEVPADVTTAGCALVLTVRPLKFGGALHLHAWTEPAAAGGGSSGAPAATTKADAPAPAAAARSTASAALELTRSGAPVEPVTALLSPSSQAGAAVRARVATRLVAPLLGDAAAAVALGVRAPATAAGAATTAAPVQLPVPRAQPLPALTAMPDDALLAIARFCDPRSLLRWEAAWAPARCRITNDERVWRGLVDAATAHPPGAVIDPATHGATGAALSLARLVFEMQLRSLLQQHQNEEEEVNPAFRSLFLSFLSVPSSRPLSFVPCASRKVFSYGWYQFVESDTSRPRAPVPAPQPPLWPGMTLPAPAHPDPLPPQPLPPLPPGVGSPDPDFTPIPGSDAGGDNGLALPFRRQRRALDEALPPVGLLQPAPPPPMPPIPPAVLPRPGGGGGVGSGGLPRGFGGFGGGGGGGGFF